MRSGCRLPTLLPVPTQLLSPSPQAILLSAFLPHASPRLRESGMSFTMWVMQHASHDRLTTGEG